MKLKLQTILVVYILLLINPAYTLAQKEDVFAKIGGQVYTPNDGELIEPQPEIFEATPMPLGVNRTIKVKWPKQSNNKEELYAELDLLRNHYKPFLETLAPQLNFKRDHVVVNDMLWREAIKEDTVNFIRTLTGGGNGWMKITLPHYGPPMGRARTYYYKEVTLDKPIKATSDIIYLCIKSADYKAKIFLNGKFCGQHTGFFAPFEFNVTGIAKQGVNKLLIELDNEPTTLGSIDSNGEHVVGDKIYAAGGLGWDEPQIGWHVCPPGMGITGEVFFEYRAPLHINDVFVRPRPNESNAEAWIEINNNASRTTPIKLSISLYGSNIDTALFKNIEYIPSTTHIPGKGDLTKPTDWIKTPLDMQYGVNFVKFVFAMDKFRWWSPQNPYLYELHIDVLDTNDNVVDSYRQTFGMRTFTMDTINKPKGRMYLNGQPVKLRGANSMGFEQQDVKRGEYNQLIDDILLAKLCNMNFIRFTQRPVNDIVYDYCDRLGMMNQTDFPLFGQVRRNLVPEVLRQVEEMEKLVRNHPSTVMITYINERFPNADGKPQRSLNEAKEYFALFDAMTQVVHLVNPDRVIKPGDGDYDPPTPGLPDNHCYNIWYNGHGLHLGKMYKGYWQPVKPDWLYACGEFGAEGLDHVNVIKKYYPREWMTKNSKGEWMPDRIALAQTFKHHFMWFPTQYNINDWVNESHKFQKWAVGMAAETFRRNNYMTSFAVHLFIDAWPAGWMKTLMDTERQPKPAYFAYRDALRPLCVSLRSDRTQFWSGDTTNIEVWVCNDLNKIPTDYKLRYTITVGGKTIVAQSVNPTIDKQRAIMQGVIFAKLPQVGSRQNGTVSLWLENEKNEVVDTKQMQFSVFPQVRNRVAKIFTIDGDTLSQQIAAQCSYSTTKDLTDAKVAIISNMDCYVKHEREIKDFTMNGGRTIFYHLPPADYSLLGVETSITPTIMGKYFFANPLTYLQKKGIKPNDIFLWYDPSIDTIEPIVGSVARNLNWTPMISSGLTNWGDKEFDGYFVMGTHKVGKGKIVLLQIDLFNMTTKNPTARKIADEAMFGELQ